MLPIGPLEGFALPQLDAGPRGFDVEAHLRRVPADAKIKGTIAASAIEAVKAAGLPPPPGANAFLPFKDYPMRRMLEVQVECARRLYPDVGTQEALRRLGRTVFPAFTQTLIGRVMYGVFGNNLSSIFRLANRSFELTQSTGRVFADIIDENAVRLHFRDTYTFLSSSHLGILEGTLAACRVEGGVWFKAISEIEGDFFVVWDPRRRARGTSDDEQNAPSSTTA